MFDYAVNPKIHRSAVTKSSRLELKLCVRLDEYFDLNFCCFKCRWHYYKIRRLMATWQRFVAALRTWPTGRWKAMLLCGTHRVPVC